MVPFAAHAEEPVELTFWIRTGDAFVEAYVADYMEEHPNVKINVMKIGQYSFQPTNIFAFISALVGNVM